MVIYMQKQQHDFKHQYHVTHHFCILAIALLYSLVIATISSHVYFRITEVRLNMGFIVDLSSAEV